MGWPYASDLGERGGNPLLELAIRPRPVQDAWGYTSWFKRTLHVGALDDVWLLARPERSRMSRSGDNAKSAVSPLRSMGK